MSSEAESAGPTSEQELLAQLPEQRYFAFARAGEVVFLEAHQSWPVDTIGKISEQITKALGDSGVRAVLLPVGIRVARVESVEG